MQISKEVRKHQFVLMMLSIFFIAGSAYCSTYYVDPNGNDTTGNGTIGSPFKTITQGVSTAAAGDTIYVRGGTHIYTTTISISKSGTSGSKYYLFAYPGERPVLNFSSMADADDNRGIILSGSYWHFKGINIYGAGDNGMLISGGSNNIIELCTFYENRDSGLQLGAGAANNQIINCDSYYNRDLGDGNADGFSPKMDVGTGNYFYGCRSWNNSDDAYDGYLRGADDVTTTYENCWAMKAGYLKSGAVGGGNGNGFKMGGSDDKLLRHNVILKNCLSFQNKAKGFDQNSDLGSMTLYNCTAFNNGGNNYYISLALASGKTATVTNSVYLTGTSSLASFVVQTTNDWSTTSADFVSIDPSAAYGARKADGSLPDITFMHLAAGSDLIDGGTDVNLPYNGSAPDLGAFEFDSDTTPPAPNPMTFATLPYAASSTSIAMVASTATDSNNGVEYYFTCTAGGGRDSGWQSGTSYTDTGLTPNTSYTYTVKARDTSFNHNETAASSPASAMTLADTEAPTPSPMTWASVPTMTGPTSISMTAATAADISLPVQYYFECITDGSKSSGWQTDTAYTASNLAPSTLYSFRVKARDSAAALNETGWSSTQSAATYSPSPVAGNVTMNTLSTPRTSATFSHTVPAGNNRLLAISVMIRGNTSVSSITYAGNALTKAHSITSGISTGCATEIWYMVEPPIGTANVVVNFSASADPSAIAAVNFTGVDQNSPIGATASNLATTGTNITMNITTLNINSLIFGAATNYGGDTAPFTPGSGITELWDNATGASTASDNGQWGGYRLAETAGTYTFDTTSSASDVWTIAAVEIKAAQVATLPGRASSPVPVNGATNVSSTQDLSWTAGAGAASHDVYFGTVNPPPSIGNQAGTTYDTGTMAANTTYYWRIDEKNGSGTTTGIVWNFTTTTVLVPNVIGMTQAAAESAITDVDVLTVGTITQQYSNTIAAGLVISQDPAGGTEVNDINLAPSCVGHWKLNDNAANTTVLDSSGTGRTGTASRNTNLLAAAGKINGAFRFNGTSDYVAVQTVGTGSYTKVAWVNLESSTIAYSHNILSGYPNQAFWAPYQWSNKLSAGHNGIYNQVQDSVSLQLGTWYFVAVTYNSSTNTLTLYKNGAVVSTGSTTAPSGSSTLNIGKYSSYYFKGMIDNVMLFNRVLTGNEIAALYNDSNGTEVMPDLSVDLVVSLGRPLTTIMPLGDSMTRGWVGSAYAHGYRKPLYDKLMASGYSFDFAGSQNDGNFPAPNHEGHDGWHASGGSGGGILPNVYSWLTAHPADIVLLHIGTNDITYGDQNVNEVNDILKEIDRFSTDVKVILALIINRVPYSSLTTQFNHDVNEMAQRRIVAGDNILVVNMENALNYSTDMADATHPNDLGYAKMADVWFAALNNILPPSITSTPITNSTVLQQYNYNVNASGYPSPTYQLITCPNGMTIDHNTGLIEWLPAVVGDFNVTVRASNGQMPDANQSFVISVSLDVQPFGDNFNDNERGAMWRMTSYNPEKTRVSEYTQRLNLRAAGQMDLTASCVGHWKLNDNAANTTVLDSSGTNHNGTASRNTNLLAVADGINGAFRFNGTSDYVAVQTIGTGSYTKVAWINLELSTSPYSHNILSGGGNQAFWAPYQWSNKLSAGHNGIYNQVQDSVSLQLGTWYFVAVTYNSSTNTLTLYKNGAVVSTGSTTTPSAPSALTIGKYSSYYFKGMIDNVMLFNRVLTGDEITALYNNSNGTETLPTYTTGSNEFSANGWNVDVNDNFQAKVDFHYSSVSSPAAWVGMTIENDQDNYISITAGANGSSPYFEYEKVVDGVVTSEETARASNDGTLYISYDKALDELYLSYTGYGAANAWQTITGLLNGSWSLKPLSISLGGGSDGSSVDNDQAYLDNFAASGSFLGWPSATDLDNSGFIDWADVMVIAENWLDTGSTPADIDGDGTVNFADFAELGLAW